MTVALPTDTDLESKVRSGLWPAPDSLDSLEGGTCLVQSDPTTRFGQAARSSAGQVGKSAEPVRTWPGVI